MNERKAELISLLKENVVQVVFTKVNGEDRTMRATLKEALLPKREDTNNAYNISNDGVVRVYDLDKNDWRSFRIKSLKETKIL